MAADRLRGHSGHMSDSGRASHYWCLRHHRAETEADKCPATFVLGPYPTEAEAENALRTVRDRNEAWEAEDARWTGEHR